ncbi:hypothetical protein SLA2020_438420 [Shorea laevis]
MLLRGGASQYMSVNDKLTHIIVGAQSEMEKKEGVLQLQASRRWEEQLGSKIVIFERKKYLLKVGTLPTSHFFLKILYILSKEQR